MHVHRQIIPENAAASSQCEFWLGKKGKQDVTTKGYDAMSDFKKTATPASVKGENYTGKGSKYKHDEN